MAKNQTPLSTLPTLASEPLSCLRYDINDFLPSDQEYRPAVFLDFNRRMAQGTPAAPSREEATCEMEKMYRSRLEGLEHSVREKEARINELEKSCEEQSRGYRDVIEGLQGQVQRLTRQIASNEQEMSELREKLSHLQQQYKNKQQQVLKHQKLIDEAAESLRKKTSNIRIMCQKYQLSIPPKTKQTYTIEVQTEKHMSAAINLIPELDLQLDKNSPELRTSRRGPSTDRGHFYEMYQQQKGAKHEPGITRSQVIGSSAKPRKPSLVDNASDVHGKENDRRRANQKIEERILGKPRELRKINVKDEEIQIYPVEDAYLEDIVQGILTLK